MADDEKPAKRVRPVRVGSQKALDADDVKHAEAKRKADELKLQSEAEGEEEAREPQAAAPKAEKPKAEAPKAEKPKAEAPKAEKPKAEAPKAEKPKAEKPKAEAPKADKPKTEKPKAEKPKAEAPKAEEAKAPKPKEAKKPKKAVKEDEEEEEGEEEEEEDEDEEEEEGEAREGKKRKTRPRPRPTLDAALATALQLRREKNQKRPNFRREEWFRYQRLGEKWRFPQGIQSKMRRHWGTHADVVSIGHRGPRAARGLHPSGFREVLIHNAKGLEGVDPAREAVRIASSVGRRKREEIQTDAKKLGIRVLNWRQY